MGTPSLGQFTKHVVSLSGLVRYSVHDDTIVKCNYRISDAPIIRNIGLSSDDDFDRPKHFRINSVFFTLKINMLILLLILSISQKIHILENLNSWILN